MHGKKKKKKTLIQHSRSKGVHATGVGYCEFMSTTVRPAALKRV